MAAWSRSTFLVEVSHPQGNSATGRGQTNPAKAMQLEMTMKRRRLPKPTDRHADLLSAWVDDNGQLGIEVNDHGTVFAMLLRPADKKAVAYLAEAAGILQTLLIQPPGPPLGKKAAGKAGKRERLETRPGGIADTDEPSERSKRGLAGLVGPGGEPIIEVLKRRRGGKNR